MDMMFTHNEAREILEASQARIVRNTRALAELQRDGIAAGPDIERFNVGLSIAWARWHAAWYALHLATAHR